MKRSIFIALTASVLMCSPIFAQTLEANLTPGQSLGAFLEIKSLPNLRDVGGYQTKDEMYVVKGKTYRSNAFNPMNANELSKLSLLQLKNDYDLRTTAEIKAEPDIIPDFVRYHHLDVLADEAGVAIPPDQLEQIFQNPKIATEKFGGVKGIDEVFIKTYRDLVALPSAKKSYRTLFLSLSNSSMSPNVFHCTNGKDRTGWAAASLLTLLGVPKDKVYEDYLQSNVNLLPFHKKEIDTFVAKGGDREIPVAIFGVKRAYLDAAFDEMAKNYGSIERYFSEGLGINADTQKKIRTIYLTSSLPM